MKRNYYTCLFLLLTSFPFQSVMAQNAGDLDPTFGTGGSVITDLGNGYDKCAGLVVQPDQKVVIAGRSISSDGYAYPTLIRMNADGILDNTFEQDGIAMGDVQHSFGIVALSDPLAIQPDGKLLYVFNRLYEGGNALAITRFNSDGTIDTSFGVDGTASVDVFEFENSAHSMVLQDDGKIVLVGFGQYFSGDDAKVLAVRLTADGNLDTDFGDAGSFIYTAGGQEHLAIDVAQQADGKLLLATKKNMSTYWEYYIIRLNEDGSFDDTFGEAGSSIINVNNNYDLLQHIDVRADGTILVVGYINNGGGINSFAMICLNTDGQLNSSFGENGIVIGPFDGLTDSAQSVIEAPDGKLVLVGHHSNGAAIKGTVLRYNSNGTIDTSFGDNGISFFGEDGGVYNVENVRLQGDGKIVVCGWTGYSDTNEHHFTASRLLYEDVNAVLESASVANDLFVYPNPANDKINVQWKNNTSNEQVNISIMDVNGKIVWQSKINTSSLSTVQIETAQLVEGVYAVSILGAWTSANGKFVVGRN